MKNPISHTFSRVVIELYFFALQDSKDYPHVVDFLNFDARTFLYPDELLARQCFYQRSQQHAICQFFQVPDIRVL